MGYQFGMTTLTMDSITSMLVAVILLVGSIALYFLWFQPRTKRVLVVLRQLVVALQVPEDDWQVAKLRAEMVVKTHSWAVTAWRATEQRVVALPKEQNLQSRIVMFSSPRDIWFPPRLLVRQLNLSLAQIMPVLIVSIGFLFTLLLVTLQSPYTVRGSIEIYPTVAGLSAAVLWVVAVRHRLAALQISAEDLLEVMSHFAPIIGEQATAISHFQIAYEQQQHNHEQRELAQQLLNETRASLLLLSSLVTEAKEHSLALRRIETDLAPSLAGAVSQTLLPSFELITQRIVETIFGFREQLIEMHQESLKSMLSDFSNLLKQATESEVVHLRATLEGFAVRLDTAGLTIGYETTDAAKAIDKASRLLTSRIEKAATELTNASDGVSLAVREVEVTVKETAKLGQRGNESFADGLELADIALVQLREVIEKLGDTASTMQRVSGGVGHALAALQMKISGSARRS